MQPAAAMHGIPSYVTNNKQGILHIKLCRVLVCSTANIDAYSVGGANRISIRSKTDIY